MVTEKNDPNQDIDVQSNIDKHVAYGVRYIDLNMNNNNNNILAKQISKTNQQQI